MRSERNPIEEQKVMTSSHSKIGGGSKGKIGGGIPQYKKLATSEVVQLKKTAQPPV